MNEKATNKPDVDPEDQTYFSQTEIVNAIRASNVRGGESANLALTSEPPLARR